MMYSKINKSNINFTSGMNKNTVFACQKFNPLNIEKILTNNHIKTDCAGNKPIAFCLNQIFKIFDFLQTRTNKSLYVFNFPEFKVYKQDELIDGINVKNFCIPETQTILKNTPPFKTGSILQEQIASLEELDYVIEDDFKNGKRSSGHFLSETIHEILHSTYINHIYKKYGYLGSCPYTRSLYPAKNTIKDGLAIMKELQNKIFSQEENTIIRNVLGHYATLPLNQYHEVFAETFTKLICDCISDKDILPTKNPLDELLKYPPKFLAILTKVINI